MKTSVRIVAIVGLAVLLSGCLPIKPGRNQRCGYIGMKAFSSVCKKGLSCFADGVCREPRAQGTHCGGSQDCAGDSTCKCRDADCYQYGGVCAPRAGEGATCRSWDDCAKPTFCWRDPAGGRGVCTARYEVGVACDRDLQCRDGLFCDRGACGYVFADGQACWKDNECADGSFCIEHTCTAR